MIDKVKTTIRKHKLFREEDQLLLAVSGGLDSTVLIHLLHSFGYKITVAHVNYHLRGSDSDSDEKFVQQFAEELSLDFFKKDFDTEKLSEERGESLQMVARQLRYDWFHELLKERNLDYIVTGHHADDNLETAIFNLAKGTGISGLRGMPIQSGKVVRPLLHVSKQELQEYATSKKISWREDASNQEDKYNRNLIRNRVIPELMKINPSISAHFPHTQKRLIGPEKLLDKAVSKVRNEHFHKLKNERWELTLGWLRDEEIDIVILHEILGEFDFSFSMVDQIFMHLEGQPGKKFMNGEFTLVIDRERVLIEKQETASSHDIHMIWEDQSEIRYRRQVLHMQKTFAIDPSSIESEMMAALDCEKLSFPLTLRKWEPGDSFIPLGMKNRKKLSDFLIDEKIPIPEKNEQYVLVSDDEICWVIGRRISEAFKVTDDTDKVLVLRVHSE